MRNCFLAFFSVLITTGLVKAQAENGTMHLEKGRIIEATGQQPVPYANIGIKGKPFGTVSDSSGFFRFQLPSNCQTDTLQISRVGYRPVYLPVSKTKPGEEMQITLEEEIRSLPEVTIRPQIVRNKNSQIGRHRDGKLTQVSIHKKTSAEETLGSEMGMRYSIDQKDAMLKDFNFFISASNFNHIRFRLNIYSIKNELPDTLLTKEQIFVDLENFKTGWTKVDLEKYQIPLSDDIVITLQWIEHRMDYKEAPKTYVPVAISLFSKDCYVRVASQDVWKRMGIKISSFITVVYP